MAAERDQGNDVHNDSISSANSRCVFSSDDEYKTASETSGCGSRIHNNEDYFEWGEKEGNIVRKIHRKSINFSKLSRSSSTSTTGFLEHPPGSPPLARTLISRVKGGSFFL